MRFRPAVLGLLAALHPIIARAQIAPNSNDIEVLKNQCRVTEQILSQTRRETSAFAAAGPECAKFTAALAGSDVSKIAEAASELRKIFAAMNMPPATPKERLLAMESAAVALNGIDRFYKLVNLAKVAVDADELDKAQSYARELLQMASSYPNDWNYGNALFYGYFVLGRVALRQGNEQLAAKYLLDSGSTPGSPQLNSFGPNMTLAKELLAKGRSQAVLQFFPLCKSFWKMDRGRLDEWSATVRRGEVPEFGANLNY